MTSIRVRALALVLVALCLPLAVPAATGKGAAKLSVDQIIKKHVATRGGLEAWRGVRSMRWNGKMDLGFADSQERSRRYVAAAGAGRHAAKDRETPPAVPASVDQGARPKQVQVPFVLEMKRPTKTRIEIEFDGKTSVQVYDGQRGWLLRPYLNRSTWEPFSAEQAKSQEGNWQLDGLLIDASAKKTKVEFAGVDRVEGRDAYKLKVTQSSGEVRHVWIDAKTFLDVKVEGTPRRMDGKMRTVSVMQRNFRSVQGVTVPFELETVVDGYADTHRMILETVTLNPQLDDARFTKPQS